MIQRIRNFLVIGMLVMTGMAGVLSVSSSPADALDPSKSVEDGYKAAGGGAAGQRSLGDTIKLVINILLFVIGAVAVIMIILGGIRYVLSNGEASQITSAKNTILYAVIGLVVALLAYAIVNFVVRNFN